MELKNILRTLVSVLDWLSVLVIIYGVMVQFTGFIISELNCKDRKLAVEKVTTLKNFLGTYILFALEILIGADIIESILDPSVNHILSLASLVIIRTIISYFLNKEIKSENNK